MPSGFDRRRERGTDDPSVVRSIAVSVEDLVSALEAERRADRRVVLRLTPPFAPRMRARLHVAEDAGAEDSYGDETPTPVHLGPELFLSSSAPAYPEVDETEDRLRDAGAYSVERHRERHAEAVRTWRRAVQEALDSTVEFGVDGETHGVEVKYLGSVGDEHHPGG